MPRSLQDIRKILNNRLVELDTARAELESMYPRDSWDDDAEWWDTHYECEADTIAWCIDVLDGKPVRELTKKEP